MTHAGDASEQVRLFLAEKTLKNHVSGMLAKLGMERRTQAALDVTQHQQRPF